MCFLKKSIEKSSCEKMKNKSLNHAHPKKKAGKYLEKKLKEGILMNNIMLVNKTKQKTHTHTNMHIDVSADSGGNG